MIAPLDCLAAAAAEGLAPNLRRFLSFLGWQEGEVLELQALHVPAGRFKSNRAAHGATMATIERLAAQADAFRAQGVYAIFNQIKPAVQHRRGPDAWHDVPEGKGTKDNDIQRRRALYIDLDPERADGVKDISADTAELQAAIHRAEQAHSLLTQIIPAEAIGAGLSGNGCALFVALDPMAAEGEPARLVKAALVALACLLDDAEVKVDTGVSDAKRLCFLPGTVKRKGAHSSERPHRTAAFVGPEQPARLTLDELRRLVTELRERVPADRRADIDKALEEPKQKTPSPSAGRASPRTSTPRGDDGAFKIANEIPIRELLARFGLLEGNRPTCPGCREADSGVAIVGNGLKCSHNRCNGKGYRDGFRTVVDLVAEVEGLEAGAALRWLRENFPEAGIPEARASRAEQSSDDFHEPAPFLPLETPRDLPPFPVHALPSEVAVFVEQLTASLECPPDLPACLALGALASVSMKRFEVCPRGDWSEPLNLYLAVALEPGESKSPVFRRVFGPLYKLQKQLGESWKEQCKRIEERNKDLAKGEPEETPPPRPRLFVDDATPEKIGMILAEQGERITLASDEGTAFQHMCGLYSKNGQANGGVYLKAHDGGHYVVDRTMRESIHLESPLMTVALAVQPTVIRELAKRPDLRGRGLWGRFAYAFPASRVGSRTHDGPPVDLPVREQWEALLWGIAQATSPLPTEPAVVRFSAEAHRRFHQAELEIERAMAPGEAMASVRDWAGKLRGLIARLAGLLHIAEEPVPEQALIQLDTVERALALARYFAAHALYTFNIEMTLDPAEQAARLAWEVIQRKGWDRVTPRDVSRAVKALRKTQDAVAALDVLCRQGCLEPLRAHHGKAYSVRKALPSKEPKGEASGGALSTVVDPLSTHCRPVNPTTIHADFSDPPPLSTSTVASHERAGGCAHETLPANVTPGDNGDNGDNGVSPEVWGDFPGDNEGDNEGDNDAPANEVRATPTPPPVSRVSALEQLLTAPSEEEEEGWEALE